MTENIKRLLEIVSGDEEAKKALNALKTVEEVIAFAKEKGVTLTEADLQPQSGEMSEDELDAVAGGVYGYCPTLGKTCTYEGFVTCMVVGSHTP